MHNATPFNNTTIIGNKLQGKKILSIYYKHKPGGLCKRLYMMFDALVQAGAEVHYIAVEPYPITHPKIVPHILWVPSRNKAGTLFWCYFFLIAPFYTFLIARRNTIDMVSVFGAVYGFPALFLRVLLHIPLLIFIRANTITISKILKKQKWRSFLEELIASFSLRLSDRIVTVNDQLKRILSERARIPADKVSVLYNHIENMRIDTTEHAFFRRKLELDDAAFVILTMAVLDQRKNIELLVRAAEFLTIPAVFLILGDGPEKARLEKKAQKSKGASRIVFYGWQAEVVDFIKACDLYILPSKHEGCSNALLEALSFGLPCLVSDTPEHKEILSSDELLFDPNDAKALSGKIENITRDSRYFETIKRSCEKAGQRLQFDWHDRITRIHTEILSHV